MTSFWALIRKQFVDSRWLLVISAAALFGLSWLFVFAANRIEVRMKRSTDPRAQFGRMAFTRAMGGPSADDSSTTLEVMWWQYPFVILIVTLWPISRGSFAVAGEVERGTLDLILSRPLSRSGYLASHVMTALLGLVVLGAALVAGNAWGNRVNVIDAPPRFTALFPPALNAMALGFAMFGYTFFLSTIDIVRWRPILVGSTLTLAGFIAKVVANIPSLENWKWMEKLSIFTAYDPVEAALKGQELGPHAAILGGIGLAGIALGFIAFSVRDLPTSG